jgi:hypothetical protein
MCKKGVTRDVMVDLTYLKREEATPRGAQGGEARQVAEDPLMEWGRSSSEQQTDKQTNTKEGGKVSKRTLTDLTQKGWIRS